MLKQVLNGIGGLRCYSGMVFRMVETQENAATTNLVDNLDEQYLLECLLDDVKPPYREDTEKLHYLISTPFRYPPLEYGSRFGDITMPGYFYASEDLNTVLSEFAFYRFAFMHDMETPYTEPVYSEHMSFNVSVHSAQVADLTVLESEEIQSYLRSPPDYSFTQQLGKHLIQESGARVIRFISARSFTGGINVAVSEPSEIESEAPERCISWICQTTNAQLSVTAQNRAPVTFYYEQFLVNGKLPRLS